MLQEADDPLLGNLREERSDVGVEYKIHLLAADPDDERIQRIVLAACFPDLAPKTRRSSPDGYDCPPADAGSSNGAFFRPQSAFHLDHRDLGHGDRRLRSY